MLNVYLYIPNSINSEILNKTFELKQNSNTKDSFGTKNLANRLGLASTQEKNTFKYVPYYSWLYNEAINMESYLANN